MIIENQNLKIDSHFLLVKIKNKYHKIYTYKK
jgi:hypothetical protein